MKKILAVMLILCLTLLTFISCQSTEEYYADKVICISVSHVSGFDIQSEYDVYFENIKKGGNYELPNGDANPYEVTVTIIDIDKEQITIAFSQPMDRTDKTEIKSTTTFELSLNESEEFVTPTSGGGDIFRFSIVDKSAISAND